MSDGMNKVLLLGNLGADPELRRTPNGIAILKLRLATNESWTDKDQKQQERVEWHSVTVWGPRAEALARILTKGAGVLVEGGLRTSSYDKEGQKHYKTEVHARDVILTGRRPPGPSARPGDQGESATGSLDQAPQPPRSFRANGSAARRAEPVDDLPF
jgi:single-strand DNA-binding protein